MKAYGRIPLVGKRLWYTTILLQKTSLGGEVL
jgi:hypothetical protein